MSKTEQKRQELLEENILLAQAAKEARNKQAEADRIAKGKKTIKPLSSAVKAALVAAVALKAEQKAAAKACLVEIQEVVKKHGCSIHATPIMIPSGNGTFVLAANINISTLSPEEPTE